MSNPDKSKVKVKPEFLIIVVIVCVAAFLIGYIARGGHTPHDKETKEKGAEKKIAFWTCSMHPQVKKPGPGQCPICFMDLIPVHEGAEEEEGPRELVMSETGMKLAEINTTPVERKSVTAEVRMVGKVDYDETKLGYITAWVGGRIDRLFVDYTGIPVEKGDHLVDLYSPELISAQEELLQALKAVKELEKSDVTIIRETAQATVESARERLRLWGLKPEQIAEVEKRGKPTEHITIYAPMGGIVIHKNAVEGMYVKTGTKIYTIANLEHVWIKLEAYESDITWLKYGQPVEFETEAYPGESFRESIAFINPVLNEKTRTVDLRVNVENTDGRLRPGMFVRAKVEVRLTAGGKALNEDLAGKWISPMHPEIIKDEPGTCDVCGMPLVSAESLGYAAPDDVSPPLVIPATAPLITGKRAVVYVQLSDREKPTFEGREIVLGSRAGEYYTVRSGLEEGELVVTSGSFKIDSALQISAKPSMMSPEGDAPSPAHDHGSDTKATGKVELPEAVKQNLSEMVVEYMKLASALARDNVQEASLSAKRALGLLTSIDMASMSEEAHAAFMEKSRALSKGLKLIDDAVDIQGQREGFSLSSEVLRTMLKRFGPVLETPVYRFTYPMAFNNKGASWMQSSEQVNNPYFGAAMLRCGKLVETISGKAEE